MIRGAFPVGAACLALLASTQGCYGGSTRVIATGATVPVSLSRAVRDANGRVLRLGERDVVGQVRIQRTAWSMFYGAIDLNAETDISSELNAQVQRLGGLAVTNLRIEVQPCAWGWVWPLNWLPFWPGCSTLEVVGDAIRPRDPAAAQGPGASAQRGVTP